MATKYWISTSSTSFNTAANWSGGSAPANSDVLIFNSLGTADCTSNLGSTLTGITLIKEKSYVGSIGVLSGSTATYLTFDGGTAYLEQSSGGTTTGAGSPLCMLDFGTATASTVYVYDSASASAGGYYSPILLKGGTSVGPIVQTVYMYGGNLGIASIPGDTAYVKVYISKGSGTPQVLPTLYLGSGVTLADFTANSGTILSRSSNAITAMVINGDCKFTQMGSGAITAASVYDAATLYHRGTGNITTLNISGTIDRSQATDAITIGGTAFNIYKGAKLLLDNGKASSITRSNKALVGAAAQDITVKLPTGEFL